jgi:hypothetical protein
MALTSVPQKSFPGIYITGRVYNYNIQNFIETSPFYKARSNYCTLVLIAACSLTNNKRSNIYTDSKIYLGDDLVFKEDQKIYGDRCKLKMEDKHLIS